MVEDHVVTWNAAIEETVLVPNKPTREWAYTMAVTRQGQSSTPRCEAPSEYDVQWAFDRIKEVLAAAPALTKAPPSRES